MEEVEDVAETAVKSRKKSATQWVTKIIEDVPDCKAHPGRVCIKEGDVHDTLTDQQVSWWSVMLVWFLLILYSLLCWIIH